jgi:hypothetical protein
VAPLRGVCGFLFVVDCVKSAEQCLEWGILRLPITKEKFKKQYEKALA